MQAGAVNILYGSANGLTASGDQIFHQDTPFFEDVAEDYDHFAESLSAGDYNGDGYLDLSIGVPSEDVAGKHGAGQVHVLFGSSGGLTTDDQILLHQDSVAGFASPVESYDHFGSVPASGDFNGDGKTDLAIGVPGEDAGSSKDTGVVNVIYGHASGFDTANASEWSQNSNSAPDSSEAWDAFGTSLTVGDFDGDGADDVAVGVPGEDVASGGFSIQDAGAVNVMYGSPGMFGFDSSKHQYWNLDSSGVELSASAYDNYGTALAAGDYNGDGRFDLAIGTPLKSVGGTTPVWSMSFTGTLTACNPTTTTAIRRTRVASRKRATSRTISARTWPPVISTVTANGNWASPCRARMTIAVQFMFSTDARSMDFAQTTTKSGVKTQRVSRVRRNPETRSVAHSPQTCSPTFLSSPAIRLRR